MFGKSINRSVIAVLCTCQDKISQFEVRDPRSFNATYVVTKMAYQIRTYMTLKHEIHVFDRYFTHIYL